VHQRLPKELPTLLKAQQKEPLKEQQVLLKQLQMLQKELLKEQQVLLKQLQMLLVKLQKL